MNMVNVLENYTQIKIKGCTYIRVAEIWDIIKEMGLKATKKFIVETFKAVATKIAGFGLSKFITVEQLEEVVSDMDKEVSELETLEEIIDSVKEEDLNPEFKEILKLKYRDRIHLISNYNKKQYISLLNNLHIKKLKSKSRTDLVEIMVGILCKFVREVNRKNAFNKKIVKIIENMKALVVV